MSLFFFVVVVDSFCFATRFVRIPRDSPLFFFRETAVPGETQMKGCNMGKVCVLLDSIFCPRLPSVVISVSFLVFIFCGATNSPPLGVRSFLFCERRKETLIGRGGRAGRRSGGLGKFFFAKRPILFFCERRLFFFRLLFFFPSILVLRTPTDVRLECFCDSCFLRKSLLYTPSFPVFAKTLGFFFFGDSALCARGDDGRFSLCGRTPVASCWFGCS